MSMDVSYLGSLLAGVLSFLSPCVLPLVPPYLAFIGGLAIERSEEGEIEVSGAVGRTVASAIAFVTGFTVVFVALGATASVISGFITRYIDIFATVAGVVVILLGLHFLGAFKILLLYREKRFQVREKPVTLLGAFVVGLAFAFGWTPCVGPVLAAILLVAASDDSIFYGASLLGVYALGIGLPFILAAAFMPAFMRFMQRFRRHLGLVEKLLGAFLVATGVLFITGAVSDISYWLLETFPSLGEVG
jgi:cytochrome c-type biogenesis protein